MRCFKIKMKDTNTYIRAVMFGGNPFIQVIPAFFDEEIGVFEEDKAKKYVEMLNETHKAFLFELEEDKTK